MSITRNGQEIIQRATFVNFHLQLSRILNLHQLKRVEIFPQPMSCRVFQAIKYNNKVLPHRRNISVLVIEEKEFHDRLEGIYSFGCPKLRY